MCILFIEVLSFKKHPKSTATVSSVYFNVESVISAFNEIQNNSSMTFCVYCYNTTKHQTFPLLLRMLQCMLKPSEKLYTVYKLRSHAYLVVSLSVLRYIHVHKATNLRL